MKNRKSRRNFPPALPSQCYKWITSGLGRSLFADRGLHLLYHLGGDIVESVSRAGVFLGFLHDLFNRRALRDEITIHTDIPAS